MFQNASEESRTSVVERASDDRPRDSKQQSKKVSLIRWGALALALIVLTPIAWSYTSALRAPGTDSIGARSVEWLRSHGMTKLVVEAERFWYSHHRPPRGGKPKGGIPGAGTTQLSSAPTRVKSIAGPALPGEGIWRPVGRLAHGRPVLYITAIRPDPVHTSLLTAIARIDTTVTRTVMYAGFQEPGGVWRDMAPVPLGARASLVATFNSGFRLQDAQGGYYQEGRMIRPMVDGQATLVIRPDGSATVAKWGRDAVMGPGVAEARQNLDLIVDEAKPSPALNEDWSGRWGYTLGNSTFVWRSGLGVTADGSLLYAAGPGLTARSLANVLVAAGALRAMELDINPEWTDFVWYNSPDRAHSQDVTPTKLLEEMQQPADHYFYATSKDFFAVYIRALGQ